MPASDRGKGQGEQLVTHITCSNKEGVELTFHLADGATVTTSNRKFREALESVSAAISPCVAGASECVRRPPKLSVSSRGRPRKTAQPGTGGGRDRGGIPDGEIETVAGETDGAA